MTPSVLPSLPVYFRHVVLAVVMLAAAPAGLRAQSRCTTEPDRLK